MTTWGRGFFEWRGGRSTGNDWKATIGTGNDWNRQRQNTGILHFVQDDDVEGGFRMTTLKEMDVVRRRGEQSGRLRIYLHSGEWI
jgi:hypothetical protein